MGCVDVIITAVVALTIDQRDGGVRSNPPGEDGALLHRDLLLRGGHQAAGAGLRVPQGLLPEERLERHGLHRGAQRVSHTHGGPAAG